MKYISIVSEIIKLIRTDYIFGFTIIVHTCMAGIVCYVFIIFAVGDLANKIQRVCGHIAGNVDSLFTKLSKQF